MSSPPLRVFLSPEEDCTLFQLRKSQDIPQRTKDRAEMVRLNACGWRVQEIARYFYCAESTVRTTLHRWQQSGLPGLWDAPRPGRTRCWQEEDLDYIQNGLEESKLYSSPQTLQKLARERNLNLSIPHIRRLLKKKKQ
jgi:transposase